MTRQDAQEFRAYLQQCTDTQLSGVWMKETEAGRHDYAALAEAEGERRGLDVTWTLP